MSKTPKTKGADLTNLLNYLNRIVDDFKGKVNISRSQPTQINPQSAPESENVTENRPANSVKPTAKTASRDKAGPDRFEKISVKPYEKFSDEATKKLDVGARWRQKAGILKKINRVMAGPFRDVALYFIQHPELARTEIGGVFMRQLMSNVMVDENTPFDNVGIG